VVRSTDNKILEDKEQDHKAAKEQDHKAAKEQDHKAAKEQDHKAAKEQDHKAAKEDKKYEILNLEFKKVKSELETTKKDYEKTLNKLKYMLADFDNYRKQIEKQMNSTIETNKANILSKFLNLLDDYQRALDIIKKNKDIDNVITEGLDGIIKNFQNILQSEGVKKIESIGKVFDPNQHDVVSFSYNSDIDENVITDEIRTGYMIDDKILRPSLVIISKKKNIPNNK